MGAYLRGTWLKWDRVGGNEENAWYLIRASEKLTRKELVENDFNQKEKSIPRHVDERKSEELGEQI